MKRILLVEDDPILVVLTKKNLERLGFEIVASVASGLQAIEAVKNFHPDFILMDLGLEGNMDGIDTMVEIQKFSSVPVIYLTGNSDPSIVERSEITNVKGFLIKPINFYLLEKIAATI
jgi:CheY-like chemotaxis protein